MPGQGAGPESGRTSVVVPSPLHSKRWVEGFPMQFEQHLPRVLGLKHSTNAIILMSSLGMGEKVLRVGGDSDILPTQLCPSLSWLSGAGEPLVQLGDLYYASETEGSGPPRR